MEEWKRVVLLGTDVAGAEKKCFDFPYGGARVGDCNVQEGVVHSDAEKSGMGYGGGDLL